MQLTPSRSDSRVSQEELYGKPVEVADRERVEQVWQTSTCEKKRLCLCAESSSFICCRVWTLFSTRQ